VSPVFRHGKLRLYLLKLLDEAPRHGYEVIRLLEERFHGMYAPSAGTVYPRLAKLEREGLVEHTVEGGRKVYHITDAGRAELAARAPELEELEAEIHDSVSLLADQIREDVRDSARDLREEMARAAREARGGAGAGAGSGRTAKDEARQVKVEARRLKEQLREALREPDALADLAKTLSGLADASRWGVTFGEQQTSSRTADTEGGSAKELERLLDRFRDEIRDVARDSGVTSSQLRTAREILADTEAKLRKLLGP